MLRNLLTSTTVAFLLIEGPLMVRLNAAELDDASVLVKTNPSTSQTGDLHPFTHLARIPAGVDPATIRLETIRAVTVPTRLKQTSDSEYCSQLASRDPGGSMYCPETRVDVTAPAYGVTYSFAGAPLGTEDIGNRTTFTVYFRPDELTPQLWAEVAARKRSGLASYFTLSTNREQVDRQVIDNAGTHFCESRLIDGEWAHIAAGCQDKVVYTTASVLSGYITVKVDPGPASARASSEGSR